MRRGADNTPTRLEVLNIGFTRYTQPLDSTQRKKFEAMSSLAHIHVVGLSSDRLYRRFEEGASFHLLPLVPLAGLRFISIFVYSFVVGLRLCWTGRVKVLVCEGPFEGLAGVILRSLLGVLGKRVVLVTELHGDWETSPFLYRRIPLTSLIRPGLAVWASFVMRRSDLLRTISDFLRRRVTEVAPGVPCVVFPTYTDFELFLQDVEKLPEDPLKTVIYAGVLSPLKGVSCLIRAMSRVVAEEPRAHLTLIGDGPLRARLEQEAATAGLNERAHFLGPLSQIELRHRLHEASLLVLPSLSEGLGRVVLEAMACGLPVVASNVGGIPDLLNDGSTGFLVPPADEEALAERILWILRHGDAARRMGERGRQFVRDRFSTKRYIEGYAALFDAARKRLEASGAG